jgi:hypothetical protein
VDEILRGYDFRDLRFPDWVNLKRLGAKLCVEFAEPFNQGANLREIIDGRVRGPIDAIATIRRHWHDFTFKHPTQNWHSDPDWQMRCIRNDGQIHFDSDTRMHEHLCGAERVFHADQMRGPFFDHFHFTFKKMEQVQRAHDVAIYDAIHIGKTPPTFEEFYMK